MLKKILSWYLVAVFSALALLVLSALVKLGARYPGEAALICAAVFTLFAATYVSTS